MVNFSTLFIAAQQNDITAEEILEVETLAALGSASTYISGQIARVINDGSNNGLYVAVGPANSNATSWVAA